VTSDTICAAGIIPPSSTATTPDPVLAEHARVIHDLAKRTREDIVAIGQHLVEARDHVGHGAWLDWIGVEFGWSDQTARRFIHVYQLSCDAKFNTLVELDLPLGAATEATPTSTMVLEEFFAQASGVDILARIPAARRDAVIPDILKSIDIKDVIEVLGEQLRAELPTNPLLKLRELDNATAAETLRDAFGAGRFETIVEKVREFRAPKGRKPSKPKLKTMRMGPTGTDASSNPVFARQLRGNRSRAH
jgi:hypothetical protein